MEYGPLFVTLMGIGTVFFGLICIIFLTMIMGAVMKSTAKKPAPAAASAAAAPAPAPKPQGMQPEIVAAIIRAVISGFFTNVTELSLDPVSSVSIGVMFILMSLLCRHGAELSGTERA